MEVITLEDIILFTQSGAGAGRATNDANNKKRESILVGLFNGKFTEFLADSRWSTLKTAFHQALEHIAVAGGLFEEQLPGLRFNPNAIVCHRYRNVLPILDRFNSDRTARFGKLQAVENQVAKHKGQDVGVSESGH